jgi:hypothetical protein
MARPTSPALSRFYGSFTQHETAVAMWRRSVDWWRDTNHEASWDFKYSLYLRTGK